MRPSNLLHLYVIRVRARIVHELLAFIGIAAGVALLYAASVANTSLTASIERLTDSIVGNAHFQLAARSPDGFDEGVLARVERLPGVQAAAPTVDLQANVVGPGGRRSALLVGGDSRFARLGGESVRAFRSRALANQRMIGLPASLGRSLGLKIGSGAWIEVGGQRRRAIVGALLERADIGAVADSPIVIAPLAHVQRLAGLDGRITRLYVMAQGGSEQQVEAGLRRVAGDRLNVRSARFDIELFKKAALPTHASTTLFFALSAGVGFLLAFSAMLLTVPQRRRLLGDLRVDGYGRRVMLYVLALDALVLGLFSSGVGIAVGELLSRLLLGPAPGYLSYTFPVGNARIVTMESVLLAAAGGTVAASAAAIAPYGGLVGRHGTRPWVRAAVSIALALAALAALAATTVVMVAAPELAILGMATLTVAALLALPLLLRLSRALLDRLTYLWRDAAPFIALVQLRSREHRVRAGAIAATGTVAVLSCVALQGARADLQRGLDAAVRDIDLTASVWVTAAGESNTFATTPLTVDLGRRLARLPGVASVRRYRGGFLDWDDRRVWVLAPSREIPAPAPPSQVANASRRSLASELVRRGGWAVLASQLAEDHGLKVGDRFTLPSPVPLQLRVAALSTNLGWPPGALVLNAEDFARGWGSHAVGAYQLIARAGVSDRRLAAATRRAVGGRGAPLAVETRSERAQRHFASTRDALARLSQIGTLVLGAAALAIAAVLIGLARQRRVRLAYLRADGLADGEIRRALAIEALVLVGGGATLGAVLGLYGQALLDRALGAITGFPVFASPAVAEAIAGATLVTAAAVVVVTLVGFPSKGAQADRWPESTSEPTGWRWN